MKVETILDQIDLGAIALPEFQRGYVWNRDQVRGLMDSLYRRHPVGGLLVWVTKTENAHARGDGVLAPGSVELLLDGQQRITSLYGIIRGKPPMFFEGNVQAFSGLHFNLRDETFEYYAPLKMKADPLWVSVTEVMQRGVGEFILRLMENPTAKDDLPKYVNRLNAVAGIKEIEFHIERVTGDDKTIDVVVDIFNRVNSGGTKLSKGDLALAKVCAAWPDARAVLNERLAKWRNAGFSFRLEWLLRCITTAVTGNGFFAALDGVDTLAFQQGLVDAEKYIDSLLNIISARLGLDYDDVLGSKGSFPLLVRYLTQRQGHLADYRERDALLYWYVNTFLWGRYAGSTETVVNQDLGLITDLHGGVERLIEQLRQNRGDLAIRPTDFLGWSRGARFYPLLYMLTRVYHAQDWESGIELSQHLLGKLSGLQLHHIFPKALLYKHGYTTAEVNALANFTFLTQETNLIISDRSPGEYLPHFAKKHPGAVESHWIPADPELWKMENYREFLDGRRHLLAAAANDFLHSLLAGAIPEPKPTVPVMERPHVPRGLSIATEEEERLILGCAEWVEAQGLPSGEIMYELTDAETGEVAAVLDLAWPNGLQEGLSPPVALLIGEDEATESAANRFGFRFYTDVQAFRAYVEREVLAQTLAAD